MKLRNLFTALTAAAVTASAISASASAANAGLTFQTGVYSFRNNVNQTVAYYWDEDQEQAEFGTWKYTDADVTKNGQYKVSFEKDDSDGATTWNMLKLMFFISQTDYPDFAVTIDSLKIDGKEIEAGKTAALGSEEIKPDDYTDADKQFEGKKDYYVVGFYNTYNDEMKIIKSDDFGQKVEVIFTVSGYEEGDGVPATIGEEAPTTDTTTAAPKTDATTEAPKTTAATQAPKTDASTNAPANTTNAPSTNAPNTTSAPSSSSSNSGWIVWVIVGVVAVAAVVVIVIITSKKKKQ